MSPPPAPPPPNFPAPDPAPDPAPIPCRLEKLFTYNMLIGVVSDTELPNMVRSSFTKLLHRLWVDR